MKRGILTAILGLVCFGVALGLKALSHHEKGTVMLSPGESVEIEGATLLLKSFEIPKYPSGRPRQFVSEVFLIPSPEDQGVKREAQPASISVNHPLRYGDQWIYQHSYDAATENETELLVVRDRWLPLAAVGGFLMLLGALWNCGEKAKPALISLVPLFIVGRALLRPEPIPALQSPLLVPHVAAYVASYLIFLFAAFGIGRRFMPIGFFLMTCGLVLGGIWGKICWGDFWQYDPKEMASLATWLVYLAYFPLSRFPAAERTLRIVGAVFILLTFLVVNYVKFFAGLHSYV